MFYNQLQSEGDQIFISNVDKVGIAHLEGVEKYLLRYKPKKFFLITSFQPHKNVMKYAKRITLLNIIISTDFQKAKNKIAQQYSNSKIVLVNPYHLAGREGILDA